MTKKKPTAEINQPEAPETPEIIKKTKPRTTRKKATTSKPKKAPAVAKEPAAVSKSKKAPAVAKEPAAAGKTRKTKAAATAPAVEIIDPPAETLQEVIVNEPVTDETLAEVQPEIPVVTEIAEPIAEAEATIEETVVVPTDALEVKTNLDIHSASHELIAHEITQIEASVKEEEEEAAVEEVEVETIEKLDSYSREKLVELLEETVKQEDVQKIKTRVALIKVAFLKMTRDDHQTKLDAFLKNGGSREAFAAEIDTLTEKFNAFFEIYKKNKIKYNEDQELQKLRNLDAKKQILEELKELISSEENLKKTYDQFKELQVKWKEIGLVPSTEINNLWQSYHFLVEKFFDKVKISKELRDLDLKKNMEKKIELCEKAEELLLEPSIIRSFKQLQQYHEEWKEVGPVPQDKREDIWERFKTATDKINERRRDYYNNLTLEQEKNYLAKTALCEKAEQIVSAELSTTREWQEKTNEIDELFKLWQSIGPAPKKYNDDIWERFKTYLNTFFSTKKEFFGKLKQEQLNNYNLKLDICKQAEQLKDNTDWKKTTQEMINLQKEWKNIGPVPRKHSDKIWKRFRMACDEFFNKKQAYFSGIDAHEKENLEKKLDLIQRVKDYKFGSNRSDNLDILKGFQREWTEIGHVPIKDKNRIHDAFREAINKQLDELNISSIEMRTIDYKNRMEHAIESPGGNRNARKEIGFLSGKIFKLREEILLWENNIGFLAHSKRADLLREEFEQKIARAKEELAFSEAKLRYLQESVD